MAKLVFHAVLENDKEQEIKEQDILLQYVMSVVGHNEDFLGKLENGIAKLKQEREVSKDNEDSI